MARTYRKIEREYAQNLKSSKDLKKQLHRKFRKTQKYLIEINDFDSLEEINLNKR